MIEKLKQHLPVESSVALALIGVGLIYALGDLYRQELAILVLTYAFLALGMYVPLALTGQLSLAYNAYFAIGAYAMVIWSNRTDAPIFWAMVIAVLISTAAAILLGVATVRLTGFHLAVATLLFGIAVRHWIMSNKDITGGSLGLGGVRPIIIAGWSPDRDATIIIGVAVIWLLAMLVARVRRSPFGVALRAQMEVPAASAASGFPGRATRIISLAAGASIATLGGILFAYLNGFVTPDSFAISVVFLVLFMPVLGGLNSPWGALLGAVLVVVFTEALTFLQGPGALTFGVLTLIVLILVPGGVLGVLTAIGRWARRTALRGEKVA